MRLEARSHAEKRIEYEYDRFHLATEQRISMITIGTLGQLVFKRYLEQMDIPFSFQYQYGIYDDFDFQIDQKIVEIKTSGYRKDSEWNRLNLIYNASQLEAALNKNFYCSVQIFVNNYDKVNKLFNYKKCDTAIIAGWASIKAIAEYPPKYLPLGRAHLVPLQDLTPLSKLFTP